MQAQHLPDMQCSDQDPPSWLTRASDHRTLASAATAAGRADPVEKIFVGGVARLPLRLAGYHTSAAAPADRLGSS